MIDLKSPSWWGVKGSALPTQKPWSVSALNVTSRASNAMLWDGRALMSPVRNFPKSTGMSLSMLQFGILRLSTSAQNGPLMSSHLYKSNQLHQQGCQTGPLKVHPYPLGKEWSVKFVADAIHGLSGMSGNVRPKDVPSRYPSTIKSFLGMSLNPNTAFQRTATQFPATPLASLLCRLAEYMVIGEYTHTSYFLVTLLPIILQIRLLTDSLAGRMTYFELCKGQNWVCRDLH